MHMSLADLLEIPDGEKAVLFIGEEHDEDNPERTLALLDAFRPTALAVELRPDPLASRSLAEFKEKVLPAPSGLTLTPDGLSAMELKSRVPHEIARAYAQWYGLPLYWVDWQPRCPHHLGDVLSSDPLPLPFSELSLSMRDSLDALLGAGTAKRAMESATPRRRRRAEAHLKNIGLSTREEISAIAWYLMGTSCYGMAMRNEYTAAAIGSLQEQKIAYICGSAHLSRGNEERFFSPYTPLPDLVEAPHRYMADFYAPHRFARLAASVRSLLGGDAKRVTETCEQKLDLSRLDYPCPTCHAGPGR